MPERALDNLVRIGQLKPEPPAKAELEGLLRSGSRRLADAECTDLSLESRSFQQHRHPPGLAPRAGFEPATYRLGGGCSIP